MDILILNRKIKIAPVFLYDDIEEACLKVFKDKGLMRCIIKHRGREPVEVPHSYPTAFNIMLAGVDVSVFREETITNYPYWAIRELMMNACMHRDLQSNAPIRLYEYSDHIEIMNPGGLYGDARPENFPNVNDYRNPLIASSMRTLGYVNMFNRGIGQVQIELKNNGNPPAEFNIDLLTAFAVNIKKGTSPREKRAQVEDAGYQLDNDLYDQKRAQVNKESGHKSERKKGTSRNRPFGPKILTIQERIVEFCETPKTMAEIADFLGVRNRRKAREKYILPQLGISLEMTIPDKPTSPLQKYVAIKKDDK